MRPAGRSYYGVKVSYEPDRGIVSRTARGSVARRNLKRAARQSRWLGEQKSQMRHARWTRGLIYSKSNTCTESLYVYAAGIRVKVRAHYPGGDGRQLERPTEKTIDAALEKVAMTRQSEMLRQSTGQFPGASVGIWTFTDLSQGFCCHLQTVGARWVSGRVL